MKIVVLGTRGIPNIQGGVEKICEEIYPKLACCGCDVTIIARSPYTGKESYEYKGVKILPIPALKNKFLETVLHTFLGVFKAKSLNPDILHIHAIGPSLFVPLARLLGMRVVMTHHGFDYDRKKWNVIGKTLLKLGEYLGVKYSNRVIAISKNIAKHCRDITDRDVIIIPNGVEVRERVDANSVLAKFGLVHNKYILTVGRFVPEKGFADLMDSYQRIAHKTDHKLVIVGGADHEDEFSKGLKMQAQAIPGVVMTGVLDQIALQELYSHAGLFILPSYHEGLPVCLLEALSYGNSCLVSDIRANREVELEEDRYFEPGNIELIAHKLEIWSGKSNTELERQYRIDLIKVNYNWDTIVKNTCNVYQSCVQPGWRAKCSLPDTVPAPQPKHNEWANTPA